VRAAVAAFDTNVVVRLLVKDDEGRSGAPSRRFAALRVAMSGWSLRSARIVVTRMPETWNRRANAARFFTSPR
jgi:hypothetical protein